MVYMGVNYAALKGRDCSCFPELKLPFGFAIDLKRSVGPGFFYGDAAFLAAAAIAGWWAKKSHGLRNAAVIVGAVAVFTGVSFGVAFTGQKAGLKAPDSITVDGKCVRAFRTGESSSTSSILRAPRASQLEEHGALEISERHQICRRADKHARLGAGMDGNWRNRYRSDEVPLSRLRQTSRDLQIRLPALWGPS